MFAVAAVAVLVLFAVLGFLAAGMVAIGAGGSVRGIESTQAFQIAEAGRMYGAWAADEDIDWLYALDGTEEFPIGKGTFTLKAEEFTTTTTVPFYYYYRGNEDVVEWVEGYSEGEDSNQSKEEDHLFIEPEHRNEERTYVTDEPIDLTDVEELKVRINISGRWEATFYFIVSQSKLDDHTEYDVRRAWEEGFAGEIHIS